MVKENKLIKTVLILENFSMIKNLVKEFKRGRVEQFIEVVSSMIKGKDMEKCIGRMVLITKDFGKMGCKMEKENL